MQKMAFMCIPLCGMLLAACSQTGSKSVTEASEVPVVSITEQDISLDKFYVSDIQAVQNVEIRSRIPGFLEHIYIDEGQFVKKGQLLFSLDDKEYRAEVARAKAALDNIAAEAKTVELEVERVRVLVNKKIISPTELEVAKARLNAVKAKISEAEASLNHAYARLSYTRIKAPYDGVLDRIPLKVGSLLDEGTLITSVSDISSVYAYFNISENEYLEYLRGRKEGGAETNDAVRLVLSDGKEYELTGEVETVVSEIEESTGSIAFRARFPNPDFLLKHGASGKVKLSRKVEDALVLPQKAVFEIQDKNYVFVLDGSNKVHMRNFNPEARIEQLYIVENGLKKGERVVYEGIQNIRSGMEVSPVVVKLDSLGGRNRM